MALSPRVLVALLAFPAGWAVREATGGFVGGLVVIAAILLCTAGLDRQTAARVAVLGVGCFVVVHLIAFATTIYAGLAVGAIAYATLVAVQARRAPAT